MRAMIPGSRFPEVLGPVKDPYAALPWLAYASFLVARLFVHRVVRVITDNTTPFYPQRWRLPANGLLTGGSVGRAPAVAAR